MNRYFFSIFYPFAYPPSISNWSVKELLPPACPVLYPRYWKGTALCRNVKWIRTTTNKWETRRQSQEEHEKLFSKGAVYHGLPPIAWLNEAWATSNPQPPPFPNSHHTDIRIDLLSEAWVNSAMMLMNGQAVMQSFPLNMIQNCTRLIGENNSSPSPSVNSSLQGAT